LDNSTVNSVGAQQIYLRVVAAEFQPRNVRETFMIRPFDAKPGTGNL
jgi:uncharacterized alpha-E superfamily protein